MKKLSVDEASAATCALSSAGNSLGGAKRVEEAARSATWGEATSLKEVKTMETTPNVMAVKNEARNVSRTTSMMSREANVKQLQKAANLPSGMPSVRITENAAQLVAQKRLAISPLRLSEPKRSRVTTFQQNQHTKERDVIVLRGKRHTFRSTLHIENT